MRGLLFWLGLCSWLCACQSDAAAPTKKADGPTIKLAGVWPDKFDCGTIVTTDVLSQMLGGEAKLVDSPSFVPPGLPRPCTYDVSATNLEHWIYDFDCREGYKQRADQMFDQYKQMNADRVESFDKELDAGVLKATDDAGKKIDYKRPGAANDVAVGAKALDHNDQGILFIDDDAPCYVRVIGPDSAKRLELAKLVAKNLTYSNAPMTPRAPR